MVFKMGKMKEYFFSDKSIFYFILCLVFFPIVLQIFYVGVGFLDFEHLKWGIYKGNRLILFVLWIFIAIGIISIFRVRLTYLSIPIFISLPVSIYTLVTKESIEYEVFAAISNTSLTEAIEFFSSFIILILSGLFLIVFYSIYVFLLSPKGQGSEGFFLTKSKAFIIFFIGVFGMSLMYTYGRDTLYKTYPLSIPFYFKKYYKEMVLFKNEFNKISYVFHGDNRYIGNNSLYILIVGETARRQSMSAYGYDRNTTPNMISAINSEEVKAVVYDAISSGISTRLSVPLLLSSVNVIDKERLGSSPALPHIFNGAGFQTKLISNQQAGGRNNDIIALISNKMKVLRYLSESDDTRGYDIDIIPHVMDGGINGGEATFMVIHLMGSHWKYNQRYPEEFSIFSGVNDRVDSYDNSILYTDHIIGLVIEMMKKSNRPIQLFYTSDHGENLNDSGDGNYLHAIKEMTEYEVKVPFFFVSNLAFYHKYKEKVDKVLERKNKLVSHDNISHTILGLAGIYDENSYKKKYDLSSPGFSESKRYSINRRGEAIDVDVLFN